MPAPGTIGAIMATNLVTLAPETEITRAIKTLLDGSISGAPVVSRSGELVGVLSKKDCFRAVLNATYHQELGGTVADYMAHNVETLEADTPLMEACEVFLNSSFRRFPVMHEGRLVGQLSRADLLRAVMARWQ